MEMILHIRLLATVCGAFVVIAGSWLAMRERWPWAWSANTAGLALLVLLSLSPLPAAAIPKVAYVSSTVTEFYHDPACMFARGIANPVPYASQNDARRAGKIPHRCVTDRKVAGR